MRRSIVSLQAMGVFFEVGLTDAEVNVAEARYGFRFPPDLRAFLQTAQPVSWGWTNWRDAAADERIWDQLRRPADGICFDVERNRFWRRDWGARPDELNAALEIARQKVAEAPVLIPIFGHRYLPAEPLLAGNPVFSVHQTDIICYGVDLADYFVREFRPANANWDADPARMIRFWGELAR